MAAVNFRNATNAQGNPLTFQAITLPTSIAGDQIYLIIGYVIGAVPTLTGAGSWTHAGTDSQIAAQLGLGVWTTVATDSSLSGASTNINFTAQQKFAAIACSYSGVRQTTVFGNSTPLYAQNLTSNTTSATSPTVSPVPNSWVLTFYTSKSSTNTSYTTPAGTTLRSSVFGSGGGAVDLALFDTNGPVSSGGNQTTTESIATGNKIAGTIVLNDQLVPTIRIYQAVNRASVF